MNFEELLSRLDGVRRTGPDSAVAKCPAHEDRLPSLTARQADDRILLHCFAGCDVGQIVGAVNMELTDLFPEKIEHSKPISRPIPAADILRCLRTETIFLLVCANDMRKGEKLTDEDCERLVLASQRINAAIRAGGL